MRADDVRAQSGNENEMKGYQRQGSAVNAQAYPQPVAQPQQATVQAAQTVSQTASTPPEPYPAQDIDGLARWIIVSADREEFNARYAEVTSRLGNDTGLRDALHTRMKALREEADREADAKAMPDDIAALFKA